MWRVSNVESFRQWREDEDADLDSLIAKLSGFSPSEAMLAGTAFHSALEHGLEGEEIEVGDYRFKITADIDLHLPAIRELRTSKVYLVDGEPIGISGQVDALEGHRIDDHKTTARFDPERYFAGYQWRLYLDIFSCKQFRWNVFEMKEKDVRDYEIHAFHQIEQFRYPAMGADCHALVSDFARFVRIHKLQGTL